MEKPALVWGGRHGTGADWFAEVSTDSAPALLFSKHPAMISVKSPDIFVSSQMLRQGWRESAVEATVLCICLRSQGAMIAGQTRKLAGLRLA